MSRSSTCWLCYTSIISISVLNLSLGSLHWRLLLGWIWTMNNPVMPWVAGFIEICRFPLFPFIRLKNLAERGSEGHLAQLPTQETVGSTSLRLPWLCLIKCVEFLAFQIGDTCSSAALVPLGKNVLPNVSCKPPRPQSMAIVPFYI